jgi:GNAT superfamily N-acetyltransferase
MQNRAFLKVSPVENMNFFQREMFVGGGYLSSYELVGSVSVVFGDCPARLDLDPWLASLYVVPQRRGMGHSLELVQAAIELAAAAGAKQLHVFTESAEKLFQRCGFEILEHTMLQDVQISVLFRTLP